MRKCRSQNTKMPRKCCVPGCNSNYNTQSNYTPAFLFPKDDDRRKKWVASINRENFSPGPSAVICMNHFDDRFIIKYDKIPQSDGSYSTVQRKKYMLTDDAYPTLFQNQPHYMSKKLPKERKPPSERREEMLKRDEENFRKWCKADEIKTINEIKCGLKDKLLDSWNYNDQENCVHIYKTELLNCPQVTVALQIFENLTVRLYYKGEEINSDSVLGFILGKELKLDKWTKFEAVLSFLNTFDRKEMTANQKLSSIILQLNEICDDTSNTDDADLRKVKFITHQLRLVQSKQNRYSHEIILWAAKLYFNYPAAYLMIRESGMLTLPHQSYLRNLTSTLNISADNDYTNNHFRYLNQTDSLEAHFGQFHQMNDGNYNISYRQITESDKKLKVLTLIKLYSKNIGEFSLKHLDCPEVGNTFAGSKSSEEFSDIIYHSETVDISTSTKSVLIFIAGYVAFKARNGIACLDCISTLLTNDALECEVEPELYEYMWLMDRGGLKWPKQFTFHVVITAYQIFQLLISEEYEGKFLKQVNLKSVVMSLSMEKIITLNTICINMCFCGISSDVLVKKCLSVIVNILLTNYCKAKNDKMIKKKNNKRKISALQTLTSKDSRNDKNQTN